MSEEEADDPVAVEVRAIVARAARTMERMAAAPTAVREIHVGMTENCQLTSRGDTRSEGVVEVVRYDLRFRVLRSGGIVACGALLAGALLPVPGLHLMAPTVVPLMTVGLAGYMMSITTRLDEVRGPCPKCGTEVGARRLGHIGHEEIWIQCRSCGAPVVVHLS